MAEYGRILTVLYGTTPYRPPYHMTKTSITDGTDTDTVNTVTVYSPKRNRKEIGLGRKEIGKK